MVDYNIHPIGFSDSEASKLEVFFGLAGKRAPHWGLTTRLNEARVVLLNATSDQEVENLRVKLASWQKVIIVGNSNYGIEWPVLHRPFKLIAILQLLDQTYVSQTNELLKAVQIKAKPSKIVVTPVNNEVPVKIVQNVELKDTSFKVNDYAFSEASTDVIRSISIPKRLSPSHLISDIVARELTREILKSTSRQDTTIGRVLLVDDSDIALRYMQNRLRQFSYECDLAQSGEEALVLMDKNNYHFVFLDVMMAGLDGYQTCKTIKNNKTRRGPAPVVVMLSSRGGAIDKIRGAMSGCDAYLTKPLNNKKLSEVLAKFDFSTITERWEAAHIYQPLVDTHFRSSTH